MGSRLVRWIAAGMAAGAAGGAIRGAAEIRAHDYLGDGMDRLALLALAGPLDLGVALGAAAGAAAALALVLFRPRAVAASVARTGRAPIPALAGIAVVLVLVGAIHALAARTRTESAASPNVLFVLVDALRADGLGGYGARPSRTPVIDAFGERGWRFANAYSNAPKTVPSVASIFTGTLPVVHDIWEPLEGDAEGEGLAYLPDRFLLAPELFRNYGYRTAMITTTGWITPEVNYDQGVDEYRVTAREDEAVVAAAEEFVAKNAGERFFVYLHLLDLHDYYHADRLFEGATAAPAGVSPALWELRSAGPSRIYRVLRAEPERFTAADVAFLRAAYDRELVRLDRFFARLLAALERAGIAGQTLVVLTADHGEQFGEHGRLVHGGSALYDEVLRIPFVVGGAGIAPRVVEEPIGAIDFFPTLFELAGLPRPAIYQGRSLAGAGPWNPPNPVLSTDGTTFKLVDGGWSYIFSERRHRVELYDLGADPGEGRDLVAERAEVARRMRRELGERLRASRRHPYVSVEKEARVAMNERVEETLRSLGYL
ncbi:MAG TPA: sulfatase [Thermoanaerobaculia bacterium]|nr:sulfatase [Thermoanaerobaculia bacterium]